MIEPKNNIELHLDLLIVDTPENVQEEKHTTLFAQVGAVLLSLGFATQIWGIAVEG